MLGLPAEIWQSIALNLELPKDIRSLYQVNKQTRLMFRKHNDLFWFHILKRTGRVFNKTAYIAARQKSGRKFAQEGLKLLNGSLSSKICRDCFNARAGGGQVYKIEKNQRFTYCSECALEVFFSTSTLSAPCVLSKQLFEGRLTVSQLLLETREG